MEFNNKLVVYRVGNALAVEAARRLATDDKFRAGKPSRYATSCPGQLSLTIHPRVGAVRKPNWQWFRRHR